jgi:hypothetical protein
LVVKQLIAGGDHVKGTHLNPELRKPSKEQNPELRKKQNPELRKEQNPELRKKQNPKLRKEQNPELRKKQNPELRKKQNPELRKNPDQSGWKKAGGRQQPDAALQQECQERFTKLGGEGIVSPLKAMHKTLCKNYTKWCRGDPKAGVRGINTAKCKRWKALPCHRRLWQ